MLIRKTGMLLTLLFSTHAFASVEMDYCPWGTENCVLTSPPFLSMANDTRDNLLRLTADRAHIAITTQTENRPTFHVVATTISLFTLTTGIPILTQRMPNPP